MPESVWCRGVVPQSLLPGVTSFGSPDSLDLEVGVSMAIGGLKYKQLLSHSPLFIYAPIKLNYLLCTGTSSRLKWYGHVLRREEEYEGKRVMGMEVPGKRSRGRPKRRWLDSIRNDLSERELSGEEAQDRVKWRRLIRIIDAT